MSKKIIQDKSIGGDLLVKAKEKKNELSRRKPKRQRQITQTMLYDFFDDGKIGKILRSLYKDALTAPTSRERTAAKKEILDRLLGKAGSKSSKGIGDIFGNVNITFEAIESEKKHTEGEEGSVIEATIVSDEEAPEPGA